MEKHSLNGCAFSCILANGKGPNFGAILNLQFSYYQITANLPKNATETENFLKNVPKFFFVVKKGKFAVESVWKDIIS